MDNTRLNRSRRSLWHHIICHHIIWHHIICHHIIGRDAPYAMLDARVCYTPNPNPNPDHSGGASAACGTNTADASYIDAHTHGYTHTSCGPRLNRCVLKNVSSEFAPLGRGAWSQPMCSWWRERRESSEEVVSLTLPEAAPLRCEGGANSNLQAHAAPP